MRWCAAWVFFLLGDMIWRVFDQWLRIGLHWPLYRLYSGCMGLSDRIQGDGPGPSPSTP